MDDLAGLIAERRPLLVDGAMGTMLLERGLEPGACPDALNLTRPQALEEIAALYLEAGADILETNTFGASPMALSRYGLEDNVEAINEAAVRAVRAVAGRHAQVAACCGPSGKLLKPYGDGDPDDFHAGFRRQMSCLISAGVDAIFVETMIDLTEATLAVRAAKEIAPRIPVVATMTFDATPRGFHTMMGVSVEQAAAGLSEAGADVIGSNCGNGIEAMVEIARAFREHTDLPLAIQSNAGLPDTSSGTTVYPETPQFMATRFPDLLAAGVSIIGGCCGTTPAHTRAFRAVIDREGGTHSDAAEGG
ncbi:MAG: homocysteine S-methyltransferase family protein [Planctomycetota bacterium]|jgi:5-methyltetrahydrofolate--homocysteine methyltransferase